MATSQNRIADDTLAGAGAPAAEPSRDDSLTRKLGLRAGDVVEVRSLDEILATLDENGRLDDMPFMPEMIRYCGQRLRVSKRAHKTCDPALGIIGLRMEDAVHLENLRCDGCFHDACQADCLVFWKEAWLKRAGGPSVAAGNGRMPVCTEQTLHARTKLDPSASGADTIYVCQNTQVKHATRPVKWWDARQYAEDYASGNVSLHEMARGLAYTAWRTVTEAGIGLGTPLRWIYDRFQEMRGGSEYPLRPFGVPDGEKTPRATLDLQEGELVRVKSHDEILKTLDSRYRNRGLYFDPDYVPFTKRVFKVKRRVQRIIDERTSKMVHFKTDAIVLEDVYCEGKYAYCRRFCPRAIVPYWREIWLERAFEKGEARSDASQRGSQP
jgi:hypothetical protein